MESMDPAVLKTVLIAVVALCAFGVVPIVMALLAHQQKMAQLFMNREASQSELAARIACLETEVEHLRSSALARGNEPGSGRTPQL